MNALALLAGVLTLVAFGVHAVVGAREFRLFAPEAPGAARTAWVQALAGWHWVSATLLASGVLFLLVGATDALPLESVLLRLMSGAFLLFGLAWFVTVWVSGRGVSRRFLVLGQWVFCLLIAGLAYVAS